MVEPLALDADGLDPLQERIRGVADLAVVLLQDARGEHGRQRQRHQHGQPDGEGHDEAELGEEPARRAGEEGDRDENGGERRRGGDDGEEHLPRPEHGRRARPHAERPVPLDVFQHDDRVVDDEAGGEHDGEQRQDVEREAGEIDRGQRADQRDRHGDGGDDRGAHRAQEQEDHPHDDERRLEERVQDLLQRAADEGRLVGGDPDRHAFGERRVELGDGGANARRNVERVRLRLADDAEPDAGRAVDAQRAGLLRRPEDHVGHVADAGRAVDADRRHLLAAGDARVGAHEQLLVGSRQAAGRIVERDGLQRRFEVGHGEAARGERHSGR